MPLQDRRCSDAASSEPETIQSGRSGQNPALEEVFTEGTPGHGDSSDHFAAPSSDHSRRLPTGVAPVSQCSWKLHDEGIDWEQLSFPERMQPMGAKSYDNLGFLDSQLPTAMQLPAQSLYLAHPWPQSAVPSVSSASTATTRLGSADTGILESGHSGAPQRPNDTTADGGTYTCTYHDCTRRFATVALLRKHEKSHRQAHRPNGPHRPDATGVTSSLLNTRAGPHRCDRLNPSTGERCNTVFSRRWDLTRHEGSIHNPKSQRVRCEVCSDDRTFSRPDALTRHYKLCHQLDAAPSPMSESAIQVP